VENYGGILATGQGGAQGGRQSRGEEPASPPTRERRHRAPGGEGGNGIADRGTIRHAMDKIVVGWRGYRNEKKNRGQPTP